MEKFPDRGDLSPYIYRTTDCFQGGSNEEVLFVFDKGVNSGCRHWNSQVLITPTAEGADGSCYLLLVDTGVQPIGITVLGIYTDKIVKTANGWRFQNRIAKIEMPSS